MKAYYLTKISIPAKFSISLFIIPNLFFVHCPYKGRINRANAVLTVILWLLSLLLRMEKKCNFSQAINFSLTGLRMYTGKSKACGFLRSGITSGFGLFIRPYKYASQLVRRYYYRCMDPFMKRHRLVHNGGSPKFEALNGSLNMVNSTRIS